MKVLVFGTGGYAYKILKEIEQKYEIVGFLDNQVRKQNTFIGDDLKYRVINPSELGKFHFEKVIIASINYASEMFAQLLELGVREHDIIVDFVSVIKTVYVYDLLLMQLNQFNEDNRLDIAVKYLAAENYYGKNENGFDIYREMQQKRLALTDIETEELSEKFIDLIKSFEKNNLKNDSYIVCDEKMRIMDGAHRMALCLYFKIPFIQIRITPRKFECDYSIEWFWENGFTVDNINRILYKNNALKNGNQESMIAILWPPTYEFMEEVTDELANLIQIQEVIDKEFSDFSQFQNVVRAIYSVDDIEGWKIDKKIEYMQSYHPGIRIIKFQLWNPLYRLKESTCLPLSMKVEKIKRIIRTRFKERISSYFYDIIMHVADNYCQSKMIDKILKLDLDISHCFEQIKNENYALIKMDVPYMPANFPYAYPIHKDADIICDINAFEGIVQKIIHFCQGYADREGLCVNIIDDELGKHCRIRLEYLNMLIYQFDISTEILNIKNQFVVDAIIDREYMDGYYQIRQTYEVIIRLNEIIMYPQKKHHLDYLKKCEINESLIEKYMLHDLSKIHMALNMENT